jgi:hypothetical protein
MQQFKIDPHRVAGSNQTMTGEPASPSSPKLSPEQTQAARSVSRLFALCRPQDVGDPKMFMAATVALFVEYPAEVGEQAVFAIPKRTDRPTLKAMREVLDDLYAPIARRIERERIASQPLMLAKPKRTDEQQAEIDRQIAAWRAQRA